MSFEDIDNIIAAFTILYLISLAAGCVLLYFGLKISEKKDEPGSHKYANQGIYIIGAGIFIIFSSTGIYFSKLLPEKNRLLPS